MKDVTEPKMMCCPARMFAVVLLAVLSVAQVRAADTAIQSVVTGETIMKVRTAQAADQTLIIGSGYDGHILACRVDGTPLWKTALGGVMNHDLWCEDVTGDETDEIFAASADGNLYCLNAAGKVQWKFKPNDVPMYSVCVVHKDGKPLVVCGPLDNSIYYLSPAGKQVKALPSSGYSDAKPWGNDPHKPKPPKGLHYANFLRKLVSADSSEKLLVHGSMNHMQDKGILYVFEPLADKPISKSKVTAGASVGELRVADDGSEVLLGTSAHSKNSTVDRFDPLTRKFSTLKLKELKQQVDGFGYRVAQPVQLPDGLPATSGFKYFVKYGRQGVLIPADMKAKDCEVLSCKYSFNDIWMDSKSSKMFLASAQSGGNCIHIIDLKNTNWKREYSDLDPPGTIASILKASEIVREKNRSFQRSDWEREPLPVYLMSDKVTDDIKPIVDRIKKQSSSPVFLGTQHFGTAEDWDRSVIVNKKYREKRDKRRIYTMTSQEAVDAFSSIYKGRPGAAFWAGHGNDPYMFTVDTLKKVIDAANGKKTVLIYPELEDHGDDFAYVLENHFRPLAEYAKGKNTNIYVRTKNIFWQGNIYLPMWKDALSGEFADVFVPAMEETTDKSMELSVADRSGMWASGAVNGWGSRCARDNTSFDRSRQFSHQMLPNHFLRMMIYHVSSGARYLDNFPVDQQYMSLLWELIASGALYVPQRGEIVSYSPVHLSMLEPDDEYMLEGASTKWSTYFDPAKEAKRKMVFSRLNASWHGAPVTEWDFSRYAAGVNDRRLNFLPPYPNGMVLVTPPQAGARADTDAPRGQMRDHLNPIYKNILKEHYTDGHHYWSADGKQKFAADEYYKTVQADIEAAARKLPLTVSGHVAWVAAQTSPTHLRLTLIEGGYINPKDETATITFHTAQPVKIKDVLLGTEFDVSDPSSVDVKIPAGMFRFIDIELKQPLVPAN